MPVPQPEDISIAAIRLNCDMGTPEDFQIFDSWHTQFKAHPRYQDYQMLKSYCDYITTLQPVFG